MKMNVFPLPFTSIIFLPFPYPSFIVCTGVTCLWATGYLLKPGVCYNTCIGNPNLLPVDLKLPHPPPKAIMSWIEQNCSSSVIFLSVHLIMGWN
jgi:hypothetical protein